MRLAHELVTYKSNVDFWHLRILLLFKAVTSDE